MKKRLRKKKHLKEFSEYGVELELQVRSEITEDEFEKLVDQLINFVEDNGLFCGGGYNPIKKELSFFIEVGRDVSKVIEFQLKLKQWITDKGFECDYNTAIKDAWYPERKI